MERIDLTAYASANDLEIDDALFGARARGWTLNSYNDPTADGQTDLGVEEAIEIAREDPGLIYLTRLPTIRAQVESGLAQMEIDDVDAIDALSGELEAWFESDACAPGDWMAWAEPDGIHFRMRLPSQAWSGERRLDPRTGAIEMC